MAVHYSLHENHLTADPDDYAAQVQTTDSLDLPALARSIAEHGSPWTESDIVAVFEMLARECEHQLQSGRRVNLGGLCELYPRITGVFRGPTDHFDTARHRLDVAATPGARVRSAVRDNAKVTKVDTVKPTPTPLEYKDLASGETNAALTPGNIGTLNGHHLKFNLDKKDEGIFLLTDKGDGKEAKISLVQTNRPGQLVFLVPASLPKGDYHVEVRARVRGVEELRIGRLGATLTA